MPEKNSVIGMDTVSVQLYTTLVRAGDESAVEKIITAHIPLAYVIAARFAARSRNRRDDLRQQAVLGLVQAVHWSAEGRLTHDNITGYITRTIIRYMQRFIGTDFMIPIAREAYKGKPIEVVSCDITDLDDEYYTDGLSVRHGTRMKPGIGILDLSIESSQIQKEIIESICRTPVETKVVAMRLANHTFREIGDELHMHHSNVGFIMDKIRDRYVRTCR